VLRLKSKGQKTKRKEQRAKSKRQTAKVKSQSAESATRFSPYFVSSASPMNSLKLSTQKFIKIKKYFVHQ
jgi:hypothetical protein